MCIEQLLVHGSTKKTMVGCSGFRLKLKLAHKLRSLYNVGLCYRVQHVALPSVDSHGLGNATFRSRCLFPYTYSLDSLRFRLLSLSKLRS